MYLHQLWNLPAEEEFAFLLSKALSINTMTDVFHEHLSLRCVFGWFFNRFYFVLCLQIVKLKSWQTFFKVCPVSHAVSFPPSSAP